MRGREDVGLVPMVLGEGWTWAVVGVKAMDGECVEASGMDSGRHAGKARRFASCPFCHGPCARVD